MISRQLIRTDLNLLVALQALLEERNVTRAAERLEISQPALSKILQKLREAFDDELFTDGLYIQMHTGSFPAGEIRGQLNVGPAQPGTWDDILLETGLNGVLASGATGGATRALAGDVFSARISSPDGTLANGIPILWTEIYANNMLPDPSPAPLFAASHLEPNNAQLLFNGLVGPFGPFVVGDGIDVNYLINPGLVGLTAKIQGTIIDVNALNGFVAFSEAQEVRFD